MPSATKQKRQSWHEIAQQRTVYLTNGKVLVEITGFTSTAAGEVVTVVNCAQEVADTTGFTILPSERSKWRVVTPDGA